MIDLRIGLQKCDSRCPCGGGKHDIFRCECGREQSYQPTGIKGGITEKEALKIGWTFYDGKWYCPCCGGNTEKLEQIFNNYESSDESPA